MTTVAPPARSGRAASSRSGPSTTPGGWAPRRPRAEGSGDERLSAYATVFGGQLANLVSAGGVRDTMSGWMRRRPRGDAGTVRGPDPRAGGDARRAVLHRVDGVPERPRPGYGSRARTTQRRSASSPVTSTAAGRPSPGTARSLSSAAAGSCAQRCSTPTTTRTCSRASRYSPRSGISVTGCEALRTALRIGAGQSR